MFNQQQSTKLYSFVFIVDSFDYHVAVALKFVSLHSVEWFLLFLLTSSIISYFNTIFSLLFIRCSLVSLFLSLSLWFDLCWVYMAPWYIELQIEATTQRDEEDIYFKELKDMVTVIKTLLAAGKHCVFIYSLSSCFMAPCVSVCQMFLTYPKILGHSKNRSFKTV